MGGGGKKRKRGTEGIRSRGASSSEVLQPVIEEDVWAQCETCNKWRRLPPGSVVEEDTSWYCHMNGDKLRNRCEVAEEEYSDTEYVGEVSDASRLQQASKGLDRKGVMISNGEGNAPVGMGKQQQPLGKGKGKRGKGGAPSEKHPRLLGPTVLRQHHKTLSVALGNSLKWPAGPSIGQTTARFTLDLWRSMHAIAPQSSSVAAAAANASTSAGYFKGTSQRGGQIASQAEHVSWAAVLGGTAVAQALAGKYILESPRQPVRPSGPQAGAKPPLAPTTSSIDAVSLQPAGPTGADGNQSNAKPPPAGHTVPSTPPHSSVVVTAADAVPLPGASSQAAADQALPPQPPQAASPHPAVAQPLPPLPPQAASPQPAVAQLLPPQLSQAASPLPPQAVSPQPAVAQPMPQQPPQAAIPQPAVAQPPPPQAPPGLAEQHLGGSQ